MNTLLVGSRATKYWYKDARKPNDFDFFITKEEYDRWYVANDQHLTFSKEISKNKYLCKLRVGLQLEFETSDNPSVGLFIAANAGMPTMEAFGLQFNIADASTLLAIKDSHIHWPLLWFKHIGDHAFLRSKGIEISERLKEAHATRAQERQTRGHIRPAKSMNVANEEFFNRSEKNLRRKFEHDSLHEAIKYHDVPLFAKAKKDQSKAILDRQLFELGAGRAA